MLVAGITVALTACTGGNDAAIPEGGVPSTGRTGQVAWAGLPVGDAPRIPYVAGRRYVTPSGDDEWLPRGGRGVSGVVRFAQGLLVSDAIYFEGTNGLDLVVDGKRVQSWPGSRHCSSGRPVASTRHGRVAWVTVRCPESADRSIGALHLAYADGSGQISQPVGAGLFAIVGFLGNQIVYNAGFTGGAWTTNLPGAARRIPGIDSVRDVGGEIPWLIGQRGDRANLVVDVDGDVQWRFHAGTLLAFSSDTERVLGVVSKHELAVLAVDDGHPLARIEVPVGLDAWATVWETDKSMLSLVQQDSSVAVVRVWLHGVIERVTSPRALRNGRSPFVLVPDN